MLDASPRHVRLLWLAMALAPYQGSGECSANGIVQLAFRVSASGR